MDGDFAPIADLVNLRKKHNFLLAVDDVSMDDISVLRCCFCFLCVWLSNFNEIGHRLIPCLCAGRMVEVY